MSNVAAFDRVLLDDLTAGLLIIGHFALSTSVKVEDEKAIR